MADQLAVNLDITSRASGTATVIGASAIGRWK